MRTPAGRAMRAYPRNRNELVLASASRYIADGDSVLIYAPERRSVETLGRAVVEAVDVAAIVMPIREDVIRKALRVGTEWLGTDHVAVSALRRGVALHHGDLPHPFRQELEELFRSGAIKLMISSPTLAQGLNITVATVLFSSIHRSGELIPVEEFVNVCGRAGRPFAAAEGHVIFSALDANRRQKQRSIRLWKDLLRSSETMALQSGLVELVVRLLAEMERRGLGSLDELMEYALNIRGAESAEGRLAELTVNRIDALDEAILAFIGDNPALTDDELADALDLALRDSLWDKELARMEQAGAERLKQSMADRSRYIWAVTDVDQRQRFYAAGMSLRSGMALDEILPDLLEMYERLEAAVQERDVDSTISISVEIAEGLFQVELFRGDQSLPANWKDILRRWLIGISLGASGSASPAELRFTQGVCSYSLAWGIEAIRAFQLQNNQGAAPEPSIVTPLFEYGVPVTEAVLLMRLGLESRTAAASVTNRLQPRFEDFPAALDWLEGLADLTDEIPWPAPEALEAWEDFFALYRGNRSWDPNELSEEAVWYAAPPADGTVVDVLRTGPYGRLKVYADTVAEAVGEIKARGNSFRGLVYRGRIFSPRDWNTVTL